MKLNPNNAASGRCAVAAIQDEPAGPEKLARLLKLQDLDLARYPLDANPPAPVKESHHAFVAAVALAKQLAAKVDEAEQAAAEAGKADVAAALKVAEAGGAGKLPQPTASRKAAAAVEAALVGCEAAEKLVEKAHDELIDAIQAAWTAWRKQLISDAASARAAAVEAQTRAAAAVATARNLYTAVSKLTAEVLSRDTKLAEAGHKEMRQGLPWLASTHTSRSPLQSVTLPHGTTPLVFSVDEVAGALAAEVADAGSWAQGDWLPPTDPDHDALRDAPLDLAAPWVVAAVRHEWGTTCVVCRQPQADTVADDTDGALAMVHARCKNRPPDPVELKRQAARAAMSRPRLRCSAFSKLCFHTAPLNLKN